MKQKSLLKEEDGYRRRSMSFSSEPPCLPDKGKRSTHKKWTQGIFLMLLLLTMPQLAKAAYYGNIITENRCNIDNTSFSSSEGYVYIGAMVFDNYGNGSNEFVWNTNLYVDGNHITNYYVPTTHSASDNVARAVIVRPAEGLHVLAYTSYSSLPSVSSISGYRDYNSPSWHHTVANNHYNYVLNHSASANAGNITRSANHMWLNLRYYPLYEFESQAGSKTVSVGLRDIQAREEGNSYIGTTPNKSTSVTIPRPFSISTFTATINALGGIEYSVTTSTSVTNRELYYNTTRKASSTASGTSFSGTLSGLSVSEYTASGAKLKFRAKHSPTNSRLYVYREVDMPRIAVFDGGLETENAGDGIIKLSWKTKNPDGTAGVVSRGFKIQKRIGTGEWTDCGTQSWNASSTSYTYNYTIPESERGQGNRTYSFRVVRDGMEQATNTLFNISRSVDTQTNYTQPSALLYDRITKRIYFKTENGIQPANFGFAITKTPSGGTATTISDFTSVPVSDFYRTQGYSYYFNSAIVDCEMTTYTVQTKAGTELKGNEVSINVTNTPEGNREVSLFSASKGYYNNRVQLKWKIPTTANEFTRFRVYRYAMNDLTGASKTTVYDQVYNREEEIIATNGGGGNNGTVATGTFYRYELIGVVECAGVESETKMQEDLGYAQAYGSAEGRVVFTGTSTGVENVDIVFEPLNKEETSGVNRAVDLGAEGKLSLPAQYAASTEQLTLQMWTKLRSKKTAGQQHLLFEGVTQTPVVQNLQDTVPEIGAKVWFGKYPQTWLGAVGEHTPTGVENVNYAIKDGAYYAIEPIAWKVADNRNDKLLLVAENSIETKAYSDANPITNVTWSSSSLRYWFNVADNSILKTAFSTEEQDAITTTTVTTPANGSVSGGANTNDQLFLLSIPEATQYGLEASNTTRPTPTFGYEPVSIPANESSLHIQPTGAVDIVVTNTNSSGTGSLRQAIENAPAGSVIGFDPSLAGRNIVTGRIEINKDLTIQGNGITVRTAGTPSINTQIMYISSGTVTISGIRFNLDGATDYGGLLRVDGGTVTLQSCIFSNSTATVYNAYGGAIYNNGGTVNISGCTFYNCVAGTTGGVGGAIYNRSGTLTLTSNVFYGNRAAIGNVIYRYGGTVTSGGYNVYDITSSNFAFDGTGDKLLTERGFDTSSFRPTGEDFVIVPAGTADFPTTDFYGATRTYPSAAGAAEKRVLTILVTNTNSSGAGSFSQAVIDAGPGSKVIVDPSLSGQTINITSRITISNDLTIQGNGITLKDSMINESTYEMMYIGNDASVTISGIHFTECTATGNGGCFRINQAGTVVLQSCIFSNITASSTSTANAFGGAIYSTARSLTVSGCTFYNCKATGGVTSSFGGAISNISGTLTLTGNVFYGSTATIGNVIYQGSNGTASSGAYNVYDNTSSGFTFDGTGDKEVKRLLFDTNDYYPTSTQYSTIPSGTADFPTTDFYGNARTYPSAAGAVEANPAYFYDLQTWLRSPGTTQQRAATLDASGINSAGELVNNNTVGVRPAMWVDLNSMLFTPNSGAFLASAGETNVTIIDEQPKYEVWIDHENKVNVKIFDQTVKFDSIVPVDEYFHLTQTIDHNEDVYLLSAFINGKPIGTQRLTGMYATLSFNHAYVGSDESAKRLDGLVDELRVWSEILSNNRIEQDYDRYIPANSSGLNAYYRFDEPDGVSSDFYDLSKSPWAADDYNENHGKLLGRASRTTSEAPAPEQLALKAKTEQDGSYYSGDILPYRAETGYNVTPILGVHQFDPETRIIRVSSSNPSFRNIDFTDNSKFTFNGSVVYEGGNFPVEGCSFFINGGQQTDSNNQPILSDADGKFSLTVPVGTNTIRIAKQGHTFVNDVITRNFQDDELAYNVRFEDKTRIRVVGRVVGGTVEGTKPLGFGESNNNVGPARIVLTADKDNYTFDAVDKDTIFTHFDETRSNSVKYSGANITIRTNEATGEFYADVYPERFRLMHIYTDTLAMQTDYLDNVSQQWDLTNKVTFSAETQTYLTRTWNDTIRHNPLYPHLDEIVERTDSILYNDTLSYVYRVQPSMLVVELDENDQLKMLGTNKNVPYYGEQKFTYKTASDPQGQEVSMVKLSDDGRKAAYNFIDSSNSDGYPVYSQNKLYRYLISLREVYRNWKTNAVDNTPVAGEEIRVRNEMSLSGNEQAFVLDSLGQYLYESLVLNPNTASGLRSIEFAYPCIFGDCPNEKIDAIIIGGESTGTNFTTQGPDQIFFVLRDPPGSNSYAYWETETTMEQTEGYTIEQDFSLGAMAMVQMGSKTDVLMLSGLGVSVGTSTSIEATNDLGGGLTAMESFNKEGNKVTTITTKRRIETSSDPDYVGPDADVFVGASTNLLYGYNNVLQIGNTDNAGDFDYNLFSTRDNNYHIGKNTGIAIGQSFSTTFHYTQRTIRDILIPEWHTLIRGLLKTAAAPAPASLTTPYYHSKLPTTDPRFGSMNAGGLSNGSSYEIIYPASWTNDHKLAYTDSVKLFNQQIAGWENTLRLNEGAKVKALSREHFNYSFGDGVAIDYSVVQDTTTTGKSAVGGGFIEKTKGDIGVQIAGVGIQVSVEQELSFKRMTSSGQSAGNSALQGFVLSTADSDNKLTVDIYEGVKLVEECIPSPIMYHPDDCHWYNPDSITGGFIFITRAGQTSCPYEGEYATRYYEPGTVLNVSTMRNEVPDLRVLSNQTVSGVPADGQAVYHIQLINNSESRVDGWYNLNVASGTNPDGAIVRMDGAVLTENGQPIFVPYGPDGVKKTITVERGPQKYAYENINLVMASQCQYGYLDEIFSAVELSAAFLQGCSEVVVAEPFSNWVMNTENETGGALPIKVNGFNQNFENLGWVDIQWKDSYASQWNTLKRYYFSQTIMNGDRTIGEDYKELYDRSGQIVYPWDMTTRSDGNYDVRAITACVDPISFAPFIYTPTPASTGVKDMVRPEPFGRPEPKDGVLGIDDEIMIWFNEPIVGGRIVTNGTNLDNIKVSGVRSEGQGPLYHPAALHFDGTATATTQSDITLQTPFTIEAWVRPNVAYSDGEEHIIFSHGDNFQIGIQDDFLFVRANNNSMSSDPIPFANPSPEWGRVVVSFAENGMANASYAYGSTTEKFSRNLNAYNHFGRIAIGNSVTGTQGVNADIHDLRIWTVARSESEIASTQVATYNGVENNLKHYWRLDEAEGATAIDRAGGLDATLNNATWTLPNPGKAATLASGNNLKISGSQLGFGKSNDFTVELWFKGASQTNATLFSAGNGAANTDMGSGQTIYDSSENLSIFINASGRLSVSSNGQTFAATSGNYTDNKWHHLAFTVNRVGNATMYVDGNAVLNTPASNIGGMSAIDFYVGQRGWYRGNAQMNLDFQLDNPFVGQFDDIRIWRAALDAAHIKDNKNVRLKGDEIGLAAYFPLEDYGVEYGSPVINESLKDFTELNSDIVLSSGATLTNEYAPVKMEGPNINLGFRHVVNGDKILITLTEDRSRIEKSLVTVSVDGIQDLNGNKMASAAIWTAYIDQTQLRWAEQQLALEGAPNTTIQRTIQIENTGGDSESYTITNIPTWLTVTPASGTVAAQQSATITVRAANGVNVGRYNTELLLNGKSVDQLNVSLNVKNAAPDWYVNPALYEHSSSLVGSLLIDGAFSTDADDMLAAFVGDECRGVANVTYEPSFGRYVVYLTVHSNDFIEDNFVFRIWDASASRIREATTSAALNWSNGFSAGSVNAPIIFSATDARLNDLSLNAGWTWLSLNTKNDDMSINKLFGEVSGKASVLKSKSAVSAPYQGLWQGEVETIDNVQMYKIMMNEASVLRTAGTPVEPQTTPITLLPNWNWIAYTPQGNLTVQQALAGLQAAEGDIVKDQSNFATYNNSNWTGSLTTMIPGRGYVYQSNASVAKTFTYPYVQPSTQLRASEEVLNTYYEPIAPNVYSDNMSVIAIVKNGADTLKTVELGAFIGNECRGTVISKSNGLLFLTISGETGGETVNLKVREGGTEYQAPQTITYQNDAILGSVSNPHVIQLDGTGFGNVRLHNIQIYPNPAKEFLWIIRDIKTIDLLEIVDLSGRTLIKETNFSDESIDVSALDSGVYVLRLKKDNKGAILKFVKE